MYWCVLLLCLFVTPFGAQEAPVGDISCPDPIFELVTGYVYSASEDMRNSTPGTLMLAECIEMCKNDSKCASANFETGLCVLFSSSAETNPDLLVISQYPVFTLYIQKLCVKSTNNCNRPWAYERVPGHELQTLPKKRRRVASQSACVELCLNEVDFPCRSATYNAADGDCRISDMDRHTVVGSNAFAKSETSQYLENNCVDDPVRICEFKKRGGIILKTVDSVYSKVDSLDECRILCLYANFRCHSFDYGDTEKDVCRLSHHSSATLTQIEAPYLEVPNAKTYELASCYNVTIDCRATDMIAKIKTSKMFNGKVYAKGSPNTCVKDVSNSLEFEFKIGYDDAECNVRKDKNDQGKLSSDIIVQHHDRIVTSADLGLTVHCHYDLQNTTISNDVDMEVKGDIVPAASEETVVASPNVVMRITDRRGEDVSQARVGDPLSLLFEITDRNSPYQIFVRNLVAMDDAKSGEILLIDERGCPAEPSIMGPLAKAAANTLETHFDAFKYPSSDYVLFRAMVTPCLYECEPVQCDISGFDGQIRYEDSFGRKKREIGERRIRSPENEEVLVIQSIHIADKFGFPRKNREEDPLPRTPYAGHSPNVTEVIINDEGPRRGCTNMVGLIVACSMFLLAQLVLIIAWTYFWQKKRQKKMESLPETTTESLSQLYHSGYARRL